MPKLGGREGKKSQVGTVANTFQPSATVALPSQSLPSKSAPGYLVNSSSSAGNALDPHVRYLLKFD